ncbi:MAG: 1-aminocyclopropane-1-carboxylate deaminase/D-cysteine desulfhydrase [Flavobacteriales bacterium]|nr:1-aminocyclopropane-1-carboxylate deaminase/D-cysteine desulfhydrase [Flavobacteriales bacterium]
MPSPLQRVEHTVFDNNGITFYIKRDDLIHSEISGNKWRKLKYNLQEARAQKKDTILTFGGAFSNHIASAAAIGKQKGFKTVGVIRGEEQLENPTLTRAKENGMQLYFVSRDEYKQKGETDYQLELRNKFGNVYIIPEGGANELGAQGSEEIVNEIDIDFDYICCDLGTGTTFSGVINSIVKEQYAIGFSALKGEDKLTEAVQKFEKIKRKNWHISFDYHFGGFAKRSTKLEEFIKEFREETNVPLDPIYTGKMAFGMLDLAKNEYFKKGSTVIMVHTGGLQGIEGYNKRYGASLH